MKNISTLESQIETAFGWRVIPENVISINTPRNNEGGFYSDIAEDAFYFTGRDWRELSCADFHERFEAFSRSGFNAIAYCYYLPGFLCASVREHDFSGILVDYLLYDLSEFLFKYATKDEILIKKLILLTRAECFAIQEWLIWVARVENAPDTYMRAYGNLEWLIREHDSSTFKALRATAVADSKI